MLNLTKEEKVLLSLVKAGISGGKVKIEEDDIDWEQVVAEARIQAVNILACDSAAAVKENIPAEIFQKWKTMAFRGMMNNMKVQKAQKDMVSIMEEGGYAYIILKGLAAAHYYPKPEMRNLGDVDFLIDDEKKEELSALFVNKEYTQHLENHACHIVFRKPGAHLEMHFEPSGIPNGPLGDYVREFFKGAVYKSQKTTCGGDEFCIPQPMYHGMILALHMQHHQVSEGLGLRHLCDWACFVDKTADDDFWGDLVTELEKIGLIRYIALMTKTCALYLGTRLPKWAENADETVCEEIINDIFAGGNFGRKDKVRSKSGMMVSNHGKDGTGRSKLFYLYSTLHNSSAENKPQLKNNKILWFFEDCRRGALYLARVAKGSRDSLIKMMPEAEKRKRIYSEFHLFETENTDE